MFWFFVLLWLTWEIVSVGGGYADWTELESWLRGFAIFGAVGG